MKKTLLPFLVLICFGFLSCRTPRPAAGLSKEDGKIDITLLQVNDVYEIAPLEGGKTGGMARVATLKKQYRQQNPNTLLIMAGDFVSPSIYNSLKYAGRRIRGQQMVEAMNVAGTDIAIFGNHEFDISESELQSRLNESRFDWVASNAFHKSDDTVAPFQKTLPTGITSLPKTLIKTFTDGDGTQAKIGFIGLTLPFNKASYVTYSDPLQTADSLYNRLKDSCDAVMAITHQVIGDDSLLAVRLPQLALIIGGHEHDMRLQKVGAVYITKAHANARSAYRINVSINKRNKSISVTPELKMLDPTVALDPHTDSIVQQWTAIAERNYDSLGFDAHKIVLKKGEPLDGREAEIRKVPTNFSKSIVTAIERAVPAADVAIINSGAIRVDDVLQLPITQYDILRSLPFGGGIVEVDMKGQLLIQTLEAGRNNVGLGGYLVYSSKVRYEAATRQWLIQNQPIEIDTIYKVALLDFLMTGGEANMGFLTKDNPYVVKVYPPATAITDPRSDVRLAIIRYFEKQ